MPSKFNPTPKGCLSYEEVARELRYEPDTGHLYWIKRGCRRVLGKPAGCLNHDGYRKVQINGVVMQAHRVAWLLHYREWPSKYVDHINGERDDNRIANLREVTRSQNLQNKEIVKRGKALPGTFYRKHRDKYESHMRVDGKYIGLGVYDTEEEAHQAYLDGVKRYQTHHRLPIIESKQPSSLYKFRIIEKSGRYFVNKYRLSRGAFLADFSSKDNAETFLDAMKKIQRLIDGAN